MTVRRCFAALALTVAAALAVSPFLLPRADAQVPPITIPQLPPLPDELQPVFELVSPIVWPACANAILVTVVPGVLGVPLPPEISTATGAVYVVCGAIPEPGYLPTCALDLQIVSIVSEVLSSTVGLPLPLFVIPMASLVGQVRAIEDQLPPLPSQLTPVVAGVLMCGEAGPPAPAPTTTTTAPPLPTPTAPAEVALPPITPPAVVAPPIAAPEVAAPLQPTTNRTVTTTTTGPGFRYPVVFALPIVLLALGTYLGRTLTQPLDPTRRDRR